jgi:predicted amidohydrolase YtcJ
VVSGEQGTSRSDMDVGPSDGGPAARTLVVADSVLTFHTGAEVRLPRGVVLAGGRILGFLDPDDGDARTAVSAEVDLSGSVLVPGFFDAHNHQPTAARDIGEVETAHVRSLDELVAVVAEGAARRSAGSWISTEHALTVSQLGTVELPTARDLDRATDRHPVAVRFGAHTMVLNTRGLQESGIAALAGDPRGGVVDRDPASGRPLGPIREYGAVHMVLDRLAKRPAAELPDAMRTVQARYAAAGITAVRVTGLRPGDLAMYEALVRTDGRLRNRVFGGPRIDPTLDLDAQLSVIDSWEVTTGFGGEWLRLDAVKIFIDGGIETAVGGHTHLFLDQAHLSALVRAAVSRGWSVACHAVSAAAVDMALDAYADVVGLLPPGGRLVIEHGFFASADQLERAGSLGVWLSTQPGIGSVEASLLASVLDERTSETVFPLATALGRGVRCVLGSDWNATPGHAVRPFSPLDSIRVAVTRRMADGLVFGALEAVDVATAMYLHTRAPAQLVGVDDMGGLWPGARADLVALSADPCRALDDAAMVATLVDGEVVCRNDGADTVTRPPAAR